MYGYGHSHLAFLLGCSKARLASHLRGKALQLCRAWGKAAATTSTVYGLIWPYMVQYLHFRILKFPVIYWIVLTAGWWLDRYDLSFHNWHCRAELKPVVQTGNFSRSSLEYQWPCSILFPEDLRRCRCSDIFLPASASGWINLAWMASGMGSSCFSTDFCQPRIFGLKCWTSRNPINPINPINPMVCSMFV